MQKAPSLLRSVVLRTVSRRNASYGHGKAQVTTYNDLPTPQGSWQTKYDADQRKYNMHLILGVVFCTGTIVFGRAAGLLELHLSPPSRPADR